MINILTIANSYNQKELEIFLQKDQDVFAIECENADFYYFFKGIENEMKNDILSFFEVSKIPKEIHYKKLSNDDLLFLKTQIHLKNKYNNFLNWYLEEEKLTGFGYPSTAPIFFEKGKATQDILDCCGEQLIDFTCVGDRFNENIFFIQYHDETFEKIPHDIFHRNHQDQHSDDYEIDGWDNDIFIKENKEKNPVKLFQVVYYEDQIHKTKIKFNISVFDL